MLYMNQSVDLISYDLVFKYMGLKKKIRNIENIQI